MSNTPYEDCPRKAADTNVEKNRELLLQRSIAGIKKYGTTTDASPLHLRDWLQHALEEALDMANYLQAAIALIDAGEHGGQNIVMPIYSVE